MVEEAQRCFEAALKLDPNDEKVLGLLGLTHFRLEDFESASIVYESLVEMSPDDASYHLNLGLVHLKLNRPSDAIHELNRSRELDPSQIRTVSYLGLAHARNGNYAEAYEAFLRADQDPLATEMEQYLDEKEQERIRDLVSVSSDEDISVGEEESGDIEISMDSNVDERSEDRSRSDFHDAEGDDDEFDDLSFNITEADDSGEEEDDDEDDEEEVVQEIDDELKIAAGESAAVEASSADEDIEDKETGIYKDSRRTNSVAGVIGQRSAKPMFGEPGEERDTPAGHTAPQAVSELAAERMVRPTEGGDPLEIGPGGVLVARVTHRLISRTQGVMVSSGELGFEPATRRIRGKQMEEVFGAGDAQLFAVTGEGYLVASACGEIFSVVRLDGDVLYVREEYIFAFDPNLRWENGRVPGSDLLVAQFRGAGCVAIRTPNDLLSVKLSAENVVYVESEVLAGWVGRVVPRVVKPAAGGKASSPFVECSGEGVVLLHDLRTPK